MIDQDRLSFKYSKHYLKAHATHLKWFSGNIGIENADHIAEEVAALGRVPRLLDYGSGKGFQYLGKRIHERWGGILPHCYDVGVMQLRTRPEGLFDGVICTDVMEHIAQKDLDRVLGDVFGMLRTDVPVFVYFNIFCNLAGKSFPDGTNVHLTVQPPVWWDGQLRQFARPGLTIRADYEYHRDYHLQP